MLVSVFAPPFIVLSSELAPKLHFSRPKFGAGLRVCPRKGTYSPPADRVLALALQTVPPSLSLSEFYLG